MAKSFLSPIYWVPVMLFCPMFITSPPIGPYFSLSAPVVSAGDEPHYLVLINSLIQDHDFDLRNNYASSHLGGEEAGVFSAGTELDHHVVYFLNGQRYNWYELYEYDADKWQRTPDGAPIPALKENPPAVPNADSPEYTFHPIGLALILAPLMKPFKDFEGREAILYYYTALAIILSFFAYRFLLRGFTNDKHLIHLVSIATFLGTPIWFHTTSFFTEPFLTFFAISAYALILGPVQRDRSLLAGLFIGLGQICKPPFLLFGVPLFFYLLSQRKQRQVALFSIFPFLSVLVTLYFNYILNGSPLRPAHAFIWGNPITAFPGLLFDLQHGLLPFAPILLMGFIGIPALLKTKKTEGRTILMAAVLYFTFISFWKYWHASWCYGPRLILMIIPFIMVGAVYSWKANWKTYSLLALSILINAIAVLIHYSVWNRHPFIWLKNNV